MDDTKFATLYSTLASRGATTGELDTLIAQHSANPAMEEKAFADAFIRPVLAQITAREPFFKEAQLGRQIMGRPLKARSAPQPSRPAAPPKPAAPNPTQVAPPQVAPPPRPTSTPSASMQQFARASAQPPATPPSGLSPITAPPPPNPFEAALAAAKNVLDTADHIAESGSLGDRSAEVRKALASFKADAFAKAKSDGPAALAALRKWIDFATKIAQTRTLASRPAPPPSPPPSPPSTPPTAAAPAPQNPVGAQPSADADRKKYEAAAQSLIPAVRAALQKKTLSSGPLVSAAVGNLVSVNAEIGAAVRAGDYAKASARLASLSSAAAAVDAAAQEEARQRAKRDQQRADAAAAVTAVIGSLDASPTQTTMDTTLAGVDKDKDSDFGKAIGRLVKRPRDYDKLSEDYHVAKSFALKYLADHPRKGKIKDDVTEKRRKVAEMAIATVDKWIADQARNEKQIDALCIRFSAEAGKGDGPVPPEVLDELQKLLRNPLIPPHSRDLIDATIKKILLANRLQADKALATATTDADRGKTLLQHACFKRADGGTSDVKLLTDDKGQIAYAFKSLDGESREGLAKLNLGKGASTMREVVSSRVHEELAKLGLDFGFPKAVLLENDGKYGALIQGVKGKMIDSEEITTKVDHASRERDPVKRAAIEAEIDELRKTRAELPEKVSAESLQNVILSQVLSCQWDCKWGNMIIDGDTARPIDAGTAIPTAATLADFADWGKPPAFENLITHPDTTDAKKANTILPQAKNPLPAAKVKAIVDLDVEALIDSARQERDKVIKAVPGMDASLMDESCFDIMRSSIKAAQALLARDRTQSLETFVMAYQNWFVTFSAKYAKTAAANP